MTFRNITDIYLAAALIAHGNELKGTHAGVIKSKFVFVFEDCEELSEDELDYWAGKLMVDAKGAFNAMKDLKARIYANKEGE